MKPCEYCGYDFEHKTDNCRAVLAERKRKIHHIKDSHGKTQLINISRKNILELAEYLDGKRIK